METKKQEQANEVCDKCLNYIGGDGMYEMYDEYICRECYEGYISYWDHIADISEGK